MADSFSDLIDRVKKEGQLTRNSGSNSLKTIKLQLEPISASFEAGLAGTFANVEAVLNEMSDIQKEDLANTKKQQAIARDKEQEKNAGLELGTGESDSAPGMMSGMAKGGGMIGGLMKTIAAIGGGLGMALKGLAIGLAAFGMGSVAILKGGVVLGGLMLGFSKIGTVLASDFKKMAPDFRDGLIDLSDEKIDAAAVKSNAEALAAFGLALGAEGLGRVAKAFGDIAGGISKGLLGLFGEEGSDPMADLKEFGKEDLDPKGFAVKNAEVLKDFGIAMAAVGAGGFTKAVGDLGSALFGAITGLLGGSTDLPIEKIKNLGKEDLLKQSPHFHKNVEFIKEYFNSLGDIKSAETSTNWKALGNAILGSLIGFFGGDTKIPYDKIKELGQSDVHKYKDGVEKNLPAILTFYDAMKDIQVSKGQSGLKQIGGAITGAIVGLLGQDKIPFDEIEKFTAKEYNLKNAENNIKVVNAFGRGMGELEGVTLPSEGFFSSMFDSLAFWKDGPLDNLENFVNLELDPTQAETNATTIGHIADAMEKMSKFKFTGDGERFLAAIGDSDFTDAMKELGNVGTANLKGVFDGLFGFSDPEFTKKIAAMDVDSFAPNLEKLGDALNDLGEPIDDGDALAIKQAGEGLQSMVAALSGFQGMAIGQASADQAAANLNVNNGGNTNAIDASSRTTNNQNINNNLAVNAGSNGSSMNNANPLKRYWIKD